MTDIQSENSSDANGLYFSRRTGKKKRERKYDQEKEI